MLIWQMLFKYLIYNNIQRENKMIHTIFLSLFVLKFLKNDLK